MQASDGWYWKWLSKWRRKGQEIGITEQGTLSSMEIQVLPPNSQLIKTEVVRHPTHKSILPSFQP